VVVGVVVPQELKGRTGQILFFRPSHHQAGAEVVHQAEIHKGEMVVLVVETLGINQPQFQAELQIRVMLVGKVGLMAVVVEVALEP